MAGLVVSAIGLGLGAVGGISVCSLSSHPFQKAFAVECVFSSACGCFSAGRHVASSQMP